MYLFGKTFTNELFLSYNVISLHYGLFSYFFKEYIIILLVKSTPLSLRSKLICQEGIFLGSPGLDSFQRAKSSPRTATENRTLVPWSGKLGKRLEWERTAHQV